MTDHGMLEPGSGEQGESIIENPASNSCIDCGAEVPTCETRGVAIYELDPAKGDITGVQRCENCSAAHGGITRTA